MAGILWRTLVVIHRYLGVAIGLLMAMWFVSGMVMMYVGLPRLTEAERVASLAPVPWAACCRIAAGLIADDQVFGGAQVENMLGEPVLRLRRPPRPELVVDLADGVGIQGFTAEDARAIALDAAAHMINAPAAITTADAIDEDQWTIGRYQRDRPLHRFAFDDPARTTLYISSASGEVLLRTTARERFWNWLGTVPHWLYFTALRSDGALWSEIVIWAAVLGSFLTVIGLILGITQFKRGKHGAVSPYRGLFYWHHLAGLVFGIFTLTFVASGLVSMNPWGFLEGGEAAGEPARVPGAQLPWRTIRMSLDAVRAQQPEAISLTTARLDGKLYWLATGRNGAVTRLDAQGNAAPLAEADLAAAAVRLATGTGIASQGFMNEEDAYYFSHHDRAALPVYRVILDDADHTRYYLDVTSGAPVARADADRRWYRWLFEGLHRFDFAAALRAHPVWDIVMLALLLGGAAVSLTGVYLAVRRIRQDCVLLYRFVKRPRGARVTQGAQPR